MLHAIRRFTTEREHEHSMVQTARISFTAARPGQLPTSDDIKTEELMLPPRMVEATNHNCLGGALVESLERWAFGCSIPDFLKALMLLSVDLALVVMMWTEKCALHQLSRVSVWLLNSFDLTMATYSLSKVLQMGKYKRALKQSISYVIERHLQWEPFLEPPECITASSAWRDGLKSLMLASWGTTPPGECGGGGR